MSKVVRSIRETARVSLSRKARRALARREKAEGMFSALAIESGKGYFEQTEAEFAATGSRDYSNRGIVSRYLLDRECGEHKLSDIARDLDGKLRRSEAAPDKDALSLVKGCLSHIYRRARYNAQGVGFNIRRGELGPIVEKATVVSPKAKKPSLPARPALPALPAPESQAS